VRHGISPWWQFSTRPSAAAFSRRLQALHHYSRVSQRPPPRFLDAPHNRLMELALVAGAAVQIEPCSARF